MDDTLHISAIMDERDRRYEQRFEAQERAVIVALDAVNKEFHEHLAQVRVETHAALKAAETAIAAALTASKEAVLKSEQATEKRFDSVNAFRGQLQDQASTFIPRAEAEQRISQVTEKLDTQAKTVSETFARVHSRLDLTAGVTKGLDVTTQLEDIKRQIDGNTANIITEAGVRQGGTAAVQTRMQYSAGLYAAIGVGVSALSFLLAVVVFLLAR